jgi:murein L,D-transpeptidase YcbB/YkuD
VTKEISYVSTDKCINMNLLILISYIAFFASNDPSLNIDEFIRKKVETITVGTDIFIAGEKIQCESVLPTFYLRRGFESAWANKDRKALLNVLKLADEEGLTPSDYHFEAIRDFQETVNTAEEKAELDLLLTDAFLLYASHLINGKVNPESVGSEWNAVRREGNARDFLEKALADDDVFKFLQNSAPRHREYIELKGHLKVYDRLKEAGGWTSIPDGETLKKGMIDSIRVPILMKRLSVTNDLREPQEDPFTYSEMVAEAVKNYQIRNGLESDGNLGKQTLSSLNLTIEERIEQIKVNLERYRWISKELGEHFVLVNIANYQMRVFKDDQLTFEQKVIVGKPFRKTPVFSSKMTYLVLNPTWTVPPTILFNDILPEVQKNVGYLATKNMKVLQGQGSTAIVIDPTAIDWSVLSRNRFPYTLRQDAGPTNALGVVKFIFPNKYNVYLHDTPSKELFNRTDRAFSSGCIRLNHSLGFAHYLLKEDPSWTEEKIQKVIETGREQTVILPKPINVHILYLTAWTENGQIHFRTDLYQRDPAVAKALKQAPPII